MREERVLLHLDERTRRAIDPGDPYFLEADGSDTLVRLRSSHRLRDARQLPEMLALFEPHGFLRIHRSHAVNLARVLEVHLQADGRDWEVKLEPPGQSGPARRPRRAPGALAGVWGAGRVRS